MYKGFRVNHFRFHQRIGANIELSLHACRVVSGVFNFARPAPQWSLRNLIVVIRTSESRFLKYSTENQFVSGISADFFCAEKPGSHSVLIFTFAFSIARISGEGMNGDA